jgi:uncharacterized protein YceK
MRRILVAAAIGAVAAGLAGCGKLGSLERPGPMFGQTAAATPAQRQDPNRPVQTVDPRDENSVPGRDLPGGLGDVTPTPPRP